MNIKGRRIRNLERHLSMVPEGTIIVFSARSLEEAGPTLAKMGFPDSPKVGDTLLPAATFGPVSRFNAEGRQRVHRDQPKETAHRAVEWHWKEIHGDTPVEKSDFRDVPYQRYPRTFVPPPSVELKLLATVEGRMILAAEPIRYHPENREMILHIVNLFLEIFRGVEGLTENLDRIVQADVHRLNWQVLPPGRRPWEKVIEEIAPILARAKKGNQGVITNRLQTINSYGPDFLAVGEAGFAGYLTFGFVERNLYVLECVLYGNATYAFDRDWPVLSQLSKAEVLDAGLQKARIVHLIGWHEKVRHLLG